MHRSPARKSLSWQRRVRRPWADTHRLYVLKTPLPGIESSQALPTAAGPHILEQPTWSIRSLLPHKKTEKEGPETTATPAKLLHLLQLSALPSPADAEERFRMAETLQSQLHFVKDVQRVDTVGVEPLRSIRDETRAGLDQQTLGLAELKAALSQETIVGYKRRPRRPQQDTAPEAENWEPLASASRTAGGYLVVRSSTNVTRT